MNDIYQSPSPPMGPDRQSDAYPLTERAEVEAARRFGIELNGVAVPFIEEAFIDLGPEQFASHEEYVAAAYEIWGGDL